MFFLLGLFKSLLSPEEHSTEFIILTNSEIRTVLARNKHLLPAPPPPWNCKYKRCVIAITSRSAVSILVWKFCTTTIPFLCFNSLWLMNIVLFLCPLLSSFFLHTPKHLVWVCNVFCISLRSSPQWYVRPCVCLSSELFLCDSHRHPDATAPVSPQPSRRYVTLSLALHATWSSPFLRASLPL